MEKVSPHYAKQRKSIYIREAHHRILTERKQQTREPLEALIDEALELGLSMTEWGSEAREEGN